MSYAHFVAEFLKRWHEYTTEDVDIQEASDHYKFEGFNLDAIAQKIKDFDTKRIVQLLVVFHTRGTMISKMKKSIKSDYLLDFNTLTAGFKDNSKSDKSALTLARLSLAVPSVSFLIARKVTMNQIAVNLLDGFAALSSNSVPCIVRSSKVVKRDVIWRLYIASSFNLTKIVQKKTEDDSVILEKTINYAMLSYRGAKDSAGLLELAIAEMNSMILPADILTTVGNKINFDLTNIVVPQPTV